MTSVDSQRTLSWAELNCEPYVLKAPHWYMPLSLSFTFVITSSVRSMVYRATSSAVRLSGVNSAPFRYHFTVGVVPPQMHRHLRSVPRSMIWSVSGITENGAAERTHHLTSSKYLCLLCYAHTYRSWHTPTVGVCLVFFFQNFNLNQFQGARV